MDITKDLTKDFNKEVLLPGLWLGINNYIVSEYITITFDLNLLMSVLVLINVSIIQSRIFIKLRDK